MHPGAPPAPALVLLAQKLAAPAAALQTARGPLKEKEETKTEATETAVLTEEELRAAEATLRAGINAGIRAVLRATEQA